MPPSHCRACNKGCVWTSVWKRQQRPTGHVQATEGSVAHTAHWLDSWHQSSATLWDRGRARRGMEAGNHQGHGGCIVITAPHATSSWLQGARYPRPCDTRTQTIFWTSETRYIVHVFTFTFHWLKTARNVYFLRLTQRDGLWFCWLQHFNNLIQCWSWNLITL